MTLTVPCPLVYVNASRSPTWLLRPKSLIVFGSVEPAPVRGLENSTAVGWCTVSPSGHTGWYDGPSKPALVSRQPVTGRASDCAAPKQALSSPSAGSWSPGTPSRPEQLPVFTSIFVQKSKCPISSENATL